MTDNTWNVYDFDDSSPFFQESHRPRACRELRFAITANGGSLLAVLEARGVFSASQEAIADPNANSPNPDQFSNEGNIHEYLA